MTKNLFKAERAANLKNLLKERVLLLDGATGTQIHSFNLTDKDFGKPEYAGCNEMLNMTRPDVIAEIHNRYLAAGSDIIETNSFGASPIVLEDYNLSDQAYELSRLSAEIARQRADEYTSPGKPRFVAGSISPTSRLINIASTITFDEMKENYKPVIRGLIFGGTDIILFETCTDTSNIKAGIAALKEINEELNLDVPFMVSVTIEANGTMLAGQTIEALFCSLERLGPVSVGINCGLGPEQVEPYIRTLSKIATCYTSLHPNAGLPDENGEYTQTPEIFAEFMSEIIKKRSANIVGGCCGTTPDHIRALSRVLDTEPREIVKNSASLVCGLETVEFTDETRPVFVGERTNMSGSKKFRKLIRNKDFDLAADIAKKQIIKGAGIIDINLADTETEESDNILQFYPEVLRKIKAPVMIDSSGSWELTESSLKFLQGKAIINSINFEDMERFDKIAALTSKYGASVMALLIDENEMAVSKEQKLKTASRMYERLTKKHKIPPQDIVFDCLVFPVASGDNEYYLCAKNTIEAISEIKARFPLCKFSLGISNCSFGLPAAAREVLNSAYIFHATKAGLDMAIVNSEKVVRYASLSDEEKELAENVLFNNNDENVRKFTEFYSDKKTRAKELKMSSPSENMSVEEQIDFHIAEGIKSELSAVLDKALDNRKPLDIINNMLMPAMAGVGKRFNKNELTVIEVLQSAEVMKEAVDYLKQFMSKDENLDRGRIVLATVKGDVHDIGKNLVEIVLSNNGYTVIDLGIKVDSDALIKACREHKPDAIGLSGLLVKSAVNMCQTAEDLKKAGIDIPVIVGGAALSESFTERKISPNYNGDIKYAKDAVEGLTLMNDILSRVSLKKEH